MSLLSRVKDWFVGSPPADGSEVTAEPHASRHERREAGRERHHKTGQPAWETGDKIDQGKPAARNPDAAPEILGGS